MRKWKIIYWNCEGLGCPEEILIVKFNNIEDVIRFCEMKGLKSYCIFDDYGLNVVTDGKYVTLSRYARENAAKRKKQGDKNE